MNSVLNKEISIGAFGAVFSALDEIYTLMDELFIRRFGQYVANQPKLINYIDFLNRNSCENREELEITFNEIKLEKLSFSYPNTQKKALDEITLCIKANEKIGVVGLNGSGKTSLSKILLGLYSPTSGSVLIDGQKHDFLKPLAFSATAVFQNINRYKTSLKNNVCLSDASKKVASKSVNDMLNRVGIDLQKKALNEGVETVCDKSFGGIDFSGGEWQKIAIARGIYREKSLIVLDEPTSAIDPLQEYEIYNLFKSVCSNKTAIIITHRLMSIGFCDKIAVMDDGKLLDLGTHDELIGRCLHYKLLWESSTKGMGNIAL